MAWHLIGHDINTWYGTLLCSRDPSRGIPECCHVRRRILLLADDLTQMTLGQQTEHDHNASNAVNQSVMLRHVMHPIIGHFLSSRSNITYCQLSITDLFEIGCHQRGRNVLSYMPCRCAQGNGTKLQEKEPTCRVSGRPVCMAMRTRNPLNIAVVPDGHNYSFASSWLRSCLGQASSRSLCCTSRAHEIASMGS